MVKIVKSSINHEIICKDKPALWKSLNDKFMIHTKLLNQNILLIKYCNYAPLPWLLRTTISEEFKILFFDIIDTGTINYDLLKKSKFNERDIFNKIMYKCKLYEVLKYDENKVSFSNDELVERFNIIKGEIIAGNNNSNLLIELKKLMLDLVKINKITKSDMDDVLLELEML